MTSVLASLVPDVSNQSAPSRFIINANGVMDRVTVRTKPVEIGRFTKRPTTVTSMPANPIKLIEPLILYKNEAVNVIGNNSNR